MNFLFALSVFLCYVVQSYSDDSVGEVFYVKPGGQTMVFEKELGDYKCTFTYQSQGGTHEEWHASMKIVGETLECTVVRDRSSYLYFQTFNMMLSGPGVSLQGCDVMDTGSKPVAPSAFKMDTAKNSVTDVPGQFKNHLEAVSLRASLESTAKKEL